MQFDFAAGAAKTSRVPVEVVQKPKPPEKRKPDKQNDGDASEGDGAKRVMKVKIRKKDFTEVDIPIVDPEPVKRADPARATLG